MVRAKMVTVMRRCVQDEMNQVMRLGGAVVKTSDF